MPVPKLQPHTLPLGGVAAVSKPNQTKELPEQNIVKTYQFGNSTVHIADNAYRDKTPAEIEQVLEDYHAAGWRIIQSLSDAELEQLENDDEEGGEGFGDQSE